MAAQPTSPRRVEEVLHHAAPRPPGARAPSAASRSGSSAKDTVSHGTNGSQIRSTSALLIPDASAIATTTTVGADEQQRHPGGAVAAGGRHREPGQQQRPGADDEAGQVAVPPVGLRPVRGDAVVVALPQHRVGVPPREAGRRERQHHRQRRRGRDRERPPRAPGDQHREGDQRPSAACRRTSARRSPSSSPAGTAHHSRRRRPGPGRPAPRPSRRR